VSCSSRIDCDYDNNCYTDDRLSKTGRKSTIKCITDYGYKQARINKYCEKKHGNAIVVYI